MALKIRVKSGKKKSSDSEDSVVKSIPGSSQTKPSYNIEPIDNGWLVRKSWTDKDGRWQERKKFLEENPLDKEAMD